ncbi:hypothetical protein GCM10011384_24190 [Psychrobacillus lasiicapitis]|nr:hypothetical protein GCM10011384_24190 [Psychrobacillus lasiicapitis]
MYDYYIDGHVGDIRQIDVYNWQAGYEREVKQLIVDLLQSYHKRRASVMNCKSDRDKVLKIRIC